MSIAFVRFLGMLAVLTVPLPTPAAAQAMADARLATASRDTLADILRPGDVVRLRVWREPGLTGEFAVDETGAVVLPKIGPMQVTADAPMVVKSKIIASYSKF